MEGVFMQFEGQLILQLILAALLAGCIGFEREYFGKAAGFRTHALVSVASCLMMVISIRVFEMYEGGSTNVDPSRIAAQIVTGIGFIGAGAIIRSGASVKGITTAASLWAVAGIGMACGIRAYQPAVYTTIIVILILSVFSHIGDRIEKLLKIGNGKPDNENEA